MKKAMLVSSPRLLISREGLSALLVSDALKGREGLIFQLKVASFLPDTPMERASRQDLVKSRRDRPSVPVRPRLRRYSAMSHAQVHVEVRQPMHASHTTKVGTAAWPFPLTSLKVSILIQVFPIGMPTTSPCLSCLASIGVVRRLWDPHVW